jgi:hypothetical protein
MQRAGKVSYFKSGKRGGKIGTHSTGVVWYHKEKGVNMVVRRNECNAELRDKIRKAGLYQWQVAECIGVSEFTFTRWLRSELKPEVEKMVCEAIVTLQSK